MADQLKQIKEFPQKPDFGDDDLLLIQGNGTTYNVSGRAVKRYAENAAAPQVELAAKEAQAAADAADRAEDAIQHPSIPDPVSKNWLVWDQVSGEYGETVPPVRAEGRDFEIKGYYPTLEALETAVPEPEKGYAYGVGTEAPYDIYVWDVVHGVWVNNGPMTASGDMMRSVYDPQHKHQDIFAYADEAKQAALDADVGKSMAGKTVEPTQGSTVTAGAGAEIFNDYREREFSSNGYVNQGNIASGARSHAEGDTTTASGIRSHAEGLLTIANGANSHAEGSSTTSGGTCSHAEGSNTTANGSYSHAEGANTTANGSYSHAEGYYTVASGDRAHAEGSNTTANGSYSHAEGSDTKALGFGSHSSGRGTVAEYSYETTIGKWNVKKNLDSNNYINDLFVVGKGSSDSDRSNSFRVNHGDVYGTGAFNSSGADYAELFEWSDGNPGNIDRAGRFVTLEGENIRLAGPGDDYILGIVSGAPSVVGDVYDDQWQGMYLIDVFGRPIWEDVEVPAVTEEAEYPVEVPGEGEEAPRVETRREVRVVVPAHTERRQKLNPAFDNRQLPYIPRSERPEWDAVGMLGKLVAVDDGTCVPNGWATVGEGGAATNSEERTRYRVMARLDERHVRILIL